jgi:hypothetical protein
MTLDDEALGNLIEEIADLMSRFPKLLEQRAAQIQATGGNVELANKLLQGASAMRDSGAIYVSWARHYASLALVMTDFPADSDSAGLEL